MAKYDQGGGCACGLKRVCDCGSGQADGTPVPMENKSVEEIIEGWRAETENTTISLMPVRVQDIKEIIKYFDDIDSFRSSL